MWPAFDNGSTYIHVLRNATLVCTRTTEFGVSLEYQPGLFRAILDWLCVQDLPCAEAATWQCSAGRRRRLWQEVPHSACCILRRIQGQFQLYAHKIAHKFAISA